MLHPGARTRNVTRSDQFQEEEAQPEPGFGSLQSLLNRRTFFNYFVFVAEKRYAGTQRAPKVRRLVEDSRRLYRIVVGADLLVIIIVTGAVISLGVFGALKALSPIPLVGPLFDSVTANVSAFGDLLREAARWLSRQ